MIKDENDEPEILVSLDEDDISAGGMTSVYRQLGIGSQWILNQILQDHLGLSKEEANGRYLAHTYSFETLLVTISQVFFTGTLYA